MNPDLPPKLEDIVNKALEKDRNLRYQHAADMRTDLQRLKRDTDSGRQVSAVISDPAATSSAASIAAHATSSSAVVAAARQHKLGIGVTSVVVFFLVAAAAYGIHAFLSRSRPVPFQKFSVSKITDTGKAKLVAISPDGGYILNVVDDKGQQSLWLRNVPTNSNTQVIPPERLQYIGVRFSPDGDYLYFVRGEPGTAVKYLYRAPVLGGTPQKLITDVDTNITFSPDGRSLAYVVNNNPEIGKFRLVAYSLEKGESKTLVLGNENQLLWDPAWSPDGKTIVCVGWAQAEVLSSLVAVDAITGKRISVLKSQDEFLSRPAWLPDGSGLLALSLGRETNFFRHQIVEISYRDHKVRTITHDVSDYSDLSLSADGHMAAIVLDQAHFELFGAPASELNSGQTQQLTSGARLGRFAWTPDGQVVLLLQDVLSLIRPDTGDKTPLISLQLDGVAYQPPVCANGRYIVFTLSDHGGAKSLTVWRMDAGGGNLKQLSNGRDDRLAVCSPDGKWVYYTDLFNGAMLTRVPLGGGNPERLSELPCYSRSDISPDGRLAAFLSFLPGGPRKVALVSVDSPRNTKLIDLQRPLNDFEAIRFSHDGKAVAYAFRDQDAENLWLQPLDGSPGRQITNFKTEQIRDFHWSFDGRKLGIIRGHTDSDVVLLRESKP